MDCPWIGIQSSNWHLLTYIYTCRGTHYNDKVWLLFTSKAALNIAQWVLNDPHIIIWFLNNTLLVKASLKHFSQSGIFVTDVLKLYSTAALDCRTGQSKDRYCKKELSFLLIGLTESASGYFCTVFTGNFLIVHNFKLTLPKLHNCITRTMRTNLPKTLDQLILSKCSQNQLNFTKFSPPKRRKTLHSY